MAEPAPALDDLAIGQAIRIGERPGRRIVQLSAFHGRADAVAAAVASEAGVRPGTRAGETSAGEDLVILCVGPGRFWLVGEAAARIEVDPALAATVDQSHGRAVLAVEGDRVREVLAKGCRLDLHPDGFATGRCAQTLLGPFAVLLHRLAADRFEIHVARSYAQSLRDWLQDAALEFEDDATT